MFCQFLFPHLCFSGPDSKVLATSEHHDGLHYITQSAPFSSQSTVPISSPSLAHTLMNSSPKLSESKMWHLRFKHPSEGVIQHFGFLSSKDLSCHFDCLVCLIKTVQTSIP